MKKVLLVTISVIMVLFISGCNNVNFNNKFTTEKWVNCRNDEKYKYIEDFQSKYNLLGMTSHEVKELLGEPYCERKSGDVGFDTYVHSGDSEIDMFYYYRIKDDAVKGWQIYLIEFNADIVINTSIGIEDW